MTRVMMIIGFGPLDVLRIPEVFADIQWKEVEHV